METISVYCENHTKHTNTLRGQTAEFQCDKAGGTYSNHAALNDETRASAVRCSVYPSELRYGIARVYVMGKLTEL
jgi:hypothetical protein